MSRSYKHTPISKDNKNSSHESKKLASRRFRRRCSILLIKEDYESLPIKSRELTNVYDIHDQISRWTLHQALQANKNLRRWGYYFLEKSEEEVELDWKRWFHWK